MKKMIAVLISALMLLTGCGAATKKPEPVPPSSSGEYLVYKPLFAELSFRLPEGQTMEMDRFRLGPGPLIEPEGEIPPVHSEEEKKRASLLKTLGEVFAK